MHQDGSDDAGQRPVADGEGDTLVCSAFHPTATEEQVAQLFSHFGPNVKVKRHLTQSGSGLQAWATVQLETSQAAQTACRVLDGQVVWQGMTEPMRVWMLSNTAPRSPPKASPLWTPSAAGAAPAGFPPNVQAQAAPSAITQEAMNQGLGASLQSLPSAPNLDRARYILPDGVPATPAAAQLAIDEYLANRNRSKPPPRCDADAVKLFIGNVPKHCSERSLMSVFGSIGTIVEVCIIRSLHLAESKGSAFLWYKTRHEAYCAILILHSQYAFPDAKGNLVRFVTVRPAASKVKRPGPMRHPHMPMQGGAEAYPRWPMLQAPKLPMLHPDAFQSMPGASPSPAAGMPATAAVGGPADQHGTAQPVPPGLFVHVNPSSMQALLQGPSGQAPPALGSSLHGYGGGPPAYGNVNPTWDVDQSQASEDPGSGRPAFGGKPAR